MFQPVDVSRLRIGYAALSPDCSHPGDRRRFAFYARRRGISFEVADPDREYDLIVLSLGADLSRWIRRPAHRGKLVLDMVDSYLSVRDMDVRTMFRGMAKYAFRQTRYLHLDYGRLLESICRRADAVVCSTDEQEEAIKAYCPNVHQVLDITSSSVRRVKEDYGRGAVFNIVWEGQPQNIITFRPIASVIRTLSQRHQIALHLVTNVERAIGLHNVGRLPTMRLIRSVFGDVSGIYLYEWNEEMLSTIATACDLAVIPIPLEKPMYAGKPENKLLSFWRMGVPTIVSETPAYRRAMQTAGLEMMCRTSADWSVMLEYYMTDEAARREGGQGGRACADTHYSEDEMLKRWDVVLHSVLRGDEKSRVPT